jgi:hypothetical protein
MEKNTNEFVKDLQDQQKKQEHNKHKGKGHPEEKLPTKQH